MKQHLAITFVAVIAVYLMMQLCFQIAANRERSEANRELIQRTNRRMAEMWDELRKDTAPADLGEDFEILEDGR